jgi:hypothetical protein
MAAARGYLGLSSGICCSVCEDDKHALAYLHDSAAQMLENGDIHVLGKDVEYRRMIFCR